MREYEVSLRGELIGLRREESASGLTDLWGLEPWEGGLRPSPDIPISVTSSEGEKVVILAEGVAVRWAEGEALLVSPSGMQSLGGLNSVQATSFGNRFFIIGEDFLGERRNWWNTPGGITSGPTLLVPHADVALFNNGQLLTSQGNLLRWSAVGRMDFRPEVDNTAGWLFLDFEPLWMGLLGNNILVTSSRGGGLLIPNQRGYAFREIPLPGLKSGGAISGDESSGYVFLSSDGALFWVAPSGEGRELGYREFFSGTGLTTSSFIKGRRLWAFAQEGRTLIFNGLGLFRSRQIIDSCFGDQVSGRSAGLSSWGLQTGALFRDSSDLKSLEAVEVLVVGGGLLTVGIVGGPTKQAGVERIVFPRYTGKTLTIQASGSLPPQAFIGMTLKMKYPDRRYKRGASYDPSVN